MPETRIILIDGQKGKIEDLQSENLIEVHLKSSGHIFLCHMTEVKDNRLFGLFIDTDTCDLPRMEKSGRHPGISLDDVSYMRVHAMAGGELFVRLVLMVRNAQDRAAQVVRGV